MATMIKVHIIGSDEVREVTREEAEKIVEDTYRDPVGGLVADARTGEVITQLAPEVREILIMGQMLGGG